MSALMYLQPGVKGANYGWEEIGQVSEGLTSPP